MYSSSNNKRRTHHETDIWSTLLLCRLVSLTVLSIEPLRIIASDVTARLWNAKSRIGFEWIDTNSDVLKSSVLIWNNIRRMYTSNNLTGTITIINGLWTHGLVERIISKQVGFNVSLHTKQITLKTSPSRQLIAQVLTTELTTAKIKYNA